MWGFQMDLDDLISLKECVALLPAGAATARSLKRWCTEGVTSRDGSHIRLKHVVVGRHLYTSKEAVEEFVELRAKRRVAVHIPADSYREAPEDEMADQIIRGRTLLRDKEKASYEEVECK